MRHICLLILLTAALIGCQKKKAESAAAQTSNPVAVNVFVDRPQVRVGDLVKYTISVNAQTNIDVQMPDFAENLAPMGSLLIHDWENLPEEKLPGGRVVRKKTYELETYLTGVYEIPPAKVTFAITGHTNTLYSSALCVEVVTIAKEGEMTDIRDIKGVVELLLKEKNEDHHSASLPGRRRARSAPLPQKEKRSIRAASRPGPRQGLRSPGGPPCRRAPGKRTLQRIFQPSLHRLENLH